MITESQIRSAIRSAPAKRGPIELRDGGERGAGRLALRLQARGGRVTSEWFAVYYLTGKRAIAKLGSYPAVSLADARRIFREECAPAIAAGGEPVRKMARRRHANESGKTVKELFEAYVEDMRRRKKRTADHAESILLKAEAVIGATREAASIEAKDIVPFLKEI